jgi:hypothetical protein
MAGMVSSARLVVLDVWPNQPDAVARN